jgi:hypothetical protein
MEKSDDRRSIHAAAEEAIDEDALAEMLELATGGEYEEGAEEALRAVAADEVVADTLAAAQHARRRGRPLTPEDVGDAADQRRDCCFQAPLHPTGLIVEWDIE